MKLKFFLQCIISVAAFFAMWLYMSDRNLLYFESKYFELARLLSFLISLFGGLVVYFLIGFFGSRRLEPPKDTKEPKKNKSQKNIVKNYDALIKLNELKEKGIISEDEFLTEKELILNTKRKE